MDLHASGGDDIWVEVETGRSDIPANITKLSGLAGRKAIVFTSRPLLAEHETAAREALGEEGLLLTTSELDSLR